MSRKIPEELIGIIFFVLVIVFSFLNIKIAEFRCGHHFSVAPLYPFISTIILVFLALLIADPLFKLDVSLSNGDFTGVRQRVRQLVFYYALGLVVVHAFFDGLLWCVGRAVDMRSHVNTVDITGSGLMFNSPPPGYIWVRHVPTGGEVTILFMVLNGLEIICCLALVYMALVYQKAGRS